MPKSTDRWYPMGLPFIETLEQAKHFKLESQVYHGAIYPWKEPIRSPKRTNGYRVPAFRYDGCLPA